METGASEVIKGTETCPRCSGKGFVLCPECKGTGEERNISYVVTGLCRRCQPMMSNIVRGFVACPKCQGRGIL
jgi:DnaJ-class molecular chaperone